MKLLYDKRAVKQGIRDGVYDKNGLTYSESRKHKYPSKYMFIKFLSQKKFEKIPFIAEIWSMEDWITGSVTINVELKYKVPDKRKARKR